MEGRGGEGREGRGGEGRGGRGGKGRGGKGRGAGVPPVFRFTSTNAHDLLPSLRRVCKRARVSLQDVWGDRRRGRR